MTFSALRHDRPRARVRFRIGTPNSQSEPDQNRWNWTCFSKASGRRHCKAPRTRAEAMRASQSDERWSRRRSSVVVSGGVGYYFCKPVAGIRCAELELEAAASLQFDRFKCDSVSEVCFQSRSIASIRLLVHRPPLDFSLRPPLLTDDGFGHLQTEPRDRPRPPTHTHTHTYRHQPWQDNVSSGRGSGCTLFSWPWSSRRVRSGVGRAGGLVGLSIDGTNTPCASFVGLRVPRLLPCIGRAQAPIQSDRLTHTHIHTSHQTGALAFHVPIAGSGSSASRHSCRPLQASRGASDDQPGTPQQSRRYTCRCCRC